MIDEMLLRQAGELIDNATTIVVIQGDNPDGDSLASALALEALLMEQGKIIHLICGVNIPNHLRYLSGWDRVQKSLPDSFDLSILVDCSSETLLDTLKTSGVLKWIKNKPLLVIDHHLESEGISYATAMLKPVAVATSEVIYELIKAGNWQIPLDAAEMIAVSILSDSLGFSSEATTSNSLRIMADLVDSGVDIAKLDAARRELMRREPELLIYKGKLLQRVELHDENRIALIVIPASEIEKYSHLYNPPMLVFDDMRMTVGVQVVIALKSYNDGRITGKIRCNTGTSIGADLAKHFGGGGHTYASGFKITDGRSTDTIKQELLNEAHRLLEAERDTTKQ